ncbi:DUF3139 domain-containing protein [Staphylococcus gallinarum]|jgi:hypothetical protein|uniref:DUF3139 domain-containing protein n=1 Tax=Staphylococcus gallinarum TaxID=1293 RepID=A0A0D0SFZ0_STAGA|nr:DUF3139 domain-containing protein [Staphylococcus gallinarum]KIR11230.1 hypothetical protein SH09_08805 [Staphylococcus gallinarum]MBU7217286.1 DUF3139 domain-containing protein [Staphylococcus gallinarum]MCD8785093.1 DUF3139 domain-containing protein [Staphylococcus gallinarum]MCD8792632.1 DUF3139 domain-containing protein [Staphylococcus gallinarum]MCD8821423.1 DUF3139 domain-containing protein [Staphylococcus gallinarum]
MKTFFKIFGLLVVSLIIAIAFFFGLRTYQGHKNLELVDHYLKEQNLTQQVKSEKTLYSAKKGLYYKEVKFKDDPDVTYVVQPIATYKGIVVQAFDSETKENIKHAKHNKFEKDYKPKK